MKSWSSVGTHTLQEIGCTLPHARVNIGLPLSVNVEVLGDIQDDLEDFTHLGGLDVVVEVVTECLNVGNILVAALGGQVSREQHC